MLITVKAAANTQSSVFVHYNDAGDNEQQRVAHIIDRLIVWHEKASALGETDAPTKTSG